MAGSTFPCVRKRHLTPILPHVSERDIQTPAGQQLTLMNSSYVLRQMIERYGSLYGEKTRISALKPLNPDNIADKWEAKALHSFNVNPTMADFSELVKKDNGTYLRMMIPIFTEEICLKCHRASENKVGEIRGGIAISVPL